jgi:GAF domain-containing protein
VVYLEHEALSGVFTVDHVHLVRVLASQFAISIQNVQLLEEARGHRAASLRFVPQQVSHWHKHCSHHYPH